jgi:hypothetical protein
MIEYLNRGDLVITKYPFDKLCGIVINSNCLKKKYELLINNKLYIFYLEELTLIAHVKRGGAYIK